MGAHRRAARPYRGGKRRPKTVDLAFDPHEPRDEKGRWTINPAHIVSRFMEATPGERQAGADWYPAAHRTAEALSKRYKVPVKEAAGLLAAYSPQTGWGRNQVEAAESLRYGHGLGGPKQAMYFTHDDPNVEDRVGMMATRNTRALADAVMEGKDFDAVTAGVNKDGSLKPGAPKIRSFYHLIAEGKQPDPNNPYVVIDRHAMSVAYGRRVTEQDYTRMRPGSRAKYQPFVDAYKAAAAEISRQEGRPVSPEEVQATTWLVQQRHNAAEQTRVGKTRAKLGEKDWTEWMQYASRYLGMSEGAKTGYLELARIVGEDIDLDKFYEHEPRDSKGRWTDSALSNAWIAGGKVFHEIKAGSDPELSEAFNQMLLRQPSPPSSILYRGTTSDRYASHKIGDILDWTVPKSTTTTLPTAIRFGTRKSGPPTLYRITTSAGRVLPGQERLGTMHEAVIPSGRYRVTGHTSIPLTYPGTRMEALHPNAPTSADVIDLQDVTEGERDFLNHVVAPIQPGKHRGKVRGLFDFAKRDVSKELRDSKGRWTDTPGTPDAYGAREKMLVQMEKDQSTVKDIVDEPTYREPRHDFDGAPGAGPGEGPSLKQQQEAQQRAEAQFDMPNSLAAVVWRSYQRPDAYGTVNAILRGERTEGMLKDANMYREDRHVTTAELRAATKNMFQEGGTTTREPMTVYRALRTSTPEHVGEKAATHNWAEILTPGSTFQEDGIVSSTTFRRLAQGWLGIGGNATGMAEHPEGIDPNDVVMEVRVPKGSRIVGGNTQFIETMLPPGTKFKIVSSQRTRTHNATSPFGQGRVGKPVVYTHVVAEAILPEGYSAK